MTDETKFLVVADEAVGYLQRLVSEYPHLASREVKAAIETWSNLKEKKGSLEITKPKEKAVQNELLSEEAVALMQEHQMEDVMEMLAEKFSIELDYVGFIGLIGNDRYRGALRHEAREMRKNAISFQQMADLWNSMGKPALGGDRWTAHSISTFCE